MTSPSSSFREPSRWADVTMMSVGYCYRSYQDGITCLSHLSLSFGCLWPVCLTYLSVSNICLWPDRLSLTCLSSTSVSQVDPGFAYAYTLLGHEFVLTEELDRALACFRNAIRVNNRHYNAWYVAMVTKVGWCDVWKSTGQSDQSQVYFSGKLVITAQH